MSKLLMIFAAGSIWTGQHGAVSSRFLFADTRPAFSGVTVKILKKIEKAFTAFPNVVGETMRDIISVCESTRKYNKVLIF